MTAGVKVGGAEAEVGLDLPMASSSRQPSMCENLFPAGRSAYVMLES